MNISEFYRLSIELHETHNGKLAVRPKISLRTREDLSLAYTPGVAAVCNAIAAEPKRVRDLTIKKNTVAVVSDGSSVLGLGNLGAHAAIPVMEGKAVLFKEFADIDAWPICLASQDAQTIIKTVREIAPVFGGINLEDIAAPKCFEIEAALQDIGIPVFHDDQHGAAIAVVAGLMNAARIVGKKFESLRVVVNGAGAAGTAVARMLFSGEFSQFLPRVADVIVCDSKGVIHRDREDIASNSSKAALAAFTNLRGICGLLPDALKDSDVFIGVSVANCVTEEMIRFMSTDAIVFALANPIPEIMPDAAHVAGAAVVATGRSDFPNQVNNLLVFPGIFRGVLDTGATRITNEMKAAAALALQRCLSRPTHDMILPSPLDRSVAAAVADAVRTLA